MAAHTAEGTREHILLKAGSLPSAEPTGIVIGRGGVLRAQVHLGAGPPGDHQTLQVVGGRPLVVMAPVATALRSLQEPELHAGAFEVEPSTGPRDLPLPPPSRLSLAHDDE